MATFVPGFIGIGLVPDSGGSWFLHRLLGFARAFEWMTSNRKLTAAEAHAWGLVSEVVEGDGLAARAAELAGFYAELPTRGIGMTKRLFEHAYDATLEAQLELEAELQQAATETADFAEGVDGVPREAPAAVQRELESNPSTSSSSGKRPSRCFEKTTSPSEITSNWLCSPSRAEAAMPFVFSTAARLAARRS